MMKRLFQIAIPLVCTLLPLTACKSVYYNTFYNAKQNYQLAEQRRKEMEIPGNRLTPVIYQDLYKRAIAKASAVLDLYPNSKWVDDALLMIGKAFYWREEYADALTKFQELQQNFPNSDHVPEAMYWQGMTLWAMGRVNDARMSLRLITEQIDADLFGLARLSLAKMEASEGHRESALEAYQSLLDEPGTQRALRIQAWRGMGDNLLELGRYELALEAYQQVLNAKPDTRLNFETRSQIGTVFERQGHLDEALMAYDHMLQIKRLRIYEAEIRLMQARVHRMKNNIAVAEDIYEAVIEKYPRSKYSAEAYYRQGLIAQHTHKDIEKAKTLFDQAGREDRNSEAGLAASQRQSDLVSMARYQQQAENAKDPQAALPFLFNLAELYLFNLGETDSALATYQRALALSDTTEFAPKALYAIGLIYADSLKNETGAKDAFQTLLDAHPNTPYAAQARSRLAIVRADDAPAEVRFLQAEKVKESGAPLEDYLSLLRDLVETYPHSTFAPQALFALAWTYENDLEYLDEARMHYEQVRDRYPLTRFGTLAADKLKIDFLPMPQSAAQDTTDISPPATSVPPPPASEPIASSPTGPMQAEEVDQPPELIQEATPVYPGDARAEGRPATVVVRVLVLKDGRVGQVEVITGPEPFHNAAIQAARNHHFTPGSHAGQPRDVWTELSIFFEPPE